MRIASTIALAAVFLTAQLSAFQHRLEVQHAVCAEHGEQIHAEGSSPEAAHTDDAVTASTPAFDHGHDHCFAFLARREALAPASVPTIALPEGPAVERPAIAEGAVGALSPVAVLRLAPKSSPPAQG